MYIDTSDNLNGRVCLNAFMADQLRTGRTINGITFNGSANITNYGVCNTAASTAAKTVTVNSTFVLAEGAQVVVKFDQKNTATSPTLNVNGTGAKPIVIYGVTGSSTNVTPAGSNATVDSWIEGAVQTFTYDGTNWVRDYWYNTTYTTRPISQTVATDNAEYPLLSRTTTSTDTSNGHAKFAAGVTLNPSTKTITATTFAGNLKGNADTATKLQTARTITLTGSVTGSGTFDGSDNLSITTTTNHTHSYLPLSGGTVTGSVTMSGNAVQLNKVGTSSSWYNGRDKALVRLTSYNAYSAITSMKTTNGSWDMGVYTDDWMYFTYITDTDYNASNNGNKKQIKISPQGGLYGAVWNDYAEYRTCQQNFKPGQVVYENGNDTLSISNKRLQRGCSIISDTFGFAIGETDEAKCPIAVSGRVLAYPYESREEFAQHIGWPVCSGPNGTVSIMTEEEEEKYPSRIIGTISAVPDYETWGTGNVSVNGRIWIKIR